MADPQNSSDIQIPPPQPSNGATNDAQKPVQPALTTGATSPVISLGSSPPELSGNQVIIGIGISLVLAAVFWFVGRIMTDTLVKQFAEVSAAKRAGIALFAFLASLGISATFGFLGNFWSAPYFLIPAGTLTLLLFLVFLFSFVGANRSRRR
jgi:hypothetical protein